MAAIRSALASMLGRRCSSSGSSATTYMGGRSSELPPIARPAASATRTPLLPSLRPAGLNLEVVTLVLFAAMLCLAFLTLDSDNSTTALGIESWQQFSTAGREPTDKAEGVMRMCGQRCRNRVNNLDVYDKARLSYAYAVVVLGGSTLYMMKG